MITTKQIYTTSADSAKRKILEWYKDKKKITFLSCIPFQEGDKGWEVTFSYEDN